MPKKTTDPLHIERNLFAAVAHAAFSRRRGLYQLRHCRERTNFRKAGVSWKRNQAGAVIGTEWSGLIAPIEKMRIGAHGIEGVLGGVVIREEALGFFVRAAAIEIAWRLVEEPCHRISV